MGITLKQHEPCKIGQGQQVCFFNGGAVGEFIGNEGVMGSHFLVHFSLCSHLMVQY